MRDPRRIDRILKLLRAYWMANPDLRLGQLISNTAYTGENGHLFYMEDEVVEKELEHLLAKMKEGS
jgi:uncharacterized protein YihD (DUF1040 family)